MIFVFNLDDLFAFIANSFQPQGHHNRIYILRDFFDSCFEFRHSLFHLSSTRKPSKTSRGSPDQRAPPCSNTAREPGRDPNRQAWHTSRMFPRLEGRLPEPPQTVSLAALHAARCEESRQHLRAQKPSPARRALRRRSSRPVWGALPARTSFSLTLHAPRTTAP